MDNKQPKHEVCIVKAIAERASIGLPPLDMQDGQMESFMAVAQRQIAYLEETVKELQKMPS